MNIREIAEELRGKRVAIDDAVTSYSTSMASHKSAWCHVLKSQLMWLGIESTVLGKRDDIHEYDAWLIALPMEFAGTFNLFGGASDETAARIKRLVDFQGPIWILNRPMPDVGGLVQKRMNSAGTEWKKLDADAITAKCNSIETVELELESGTFVLGDSHSVSAYVPGADISRNDGKTLFGMLKEGIGTRVPIGTPHLVTYLGNIDVRHHLCRQADPVKSGTDLASAYLKQLSELEVSRKTVVKLLPIEHEGRAIPKTGYYKGTPFYGARELRDQVMKAFNEFLDQHASDYGIELMAWPDSWYEMPPEQYAKAYMERPKSVHLSREYYQYDLDTGKKNPKLLNKSVALF